MEGGESFTGHPRPRSRDFREGRCALSPSVLSADLRDDTLSTAPASVRSIMGAPEGGREAGRWLFRGGWFLGDFHGRVLRISNDEVVGVLGPERIEVSALVVEMGSSVLFFDKRDSALLVRSRCCAAGE